MVARRIQNSTAAAVVFFLILIWGISLKMVARKIRNSKFGRCRGQFLNFGINLKMVGRKIQTSKFDRCRGRILNFDFC